MKMKTLLFLLAKKKSADGEFDEFDEAALGETRGEKRATRRVALGGSRRRVTHTLCTIAAAPPPPKRRSRTKLIGNDG